MDNEIELKLAVDSDVRELLESKLFPVLKATWEASDSQLFNQYYDTPDRDLRKHGIGFRIRRAEDYIEQTIKTRGKVTGGLHQRPEYSVPLQSLEPDLDLFDGDIWPDDLSLSRVQAQLMPTFKTDFLRRAYQLHFADGSHVEMVFDQGGVVAGEQTDPICEVELELKSGDPALLFHIALKMTEFTPVRLSNLSKAARGFMLADGKTLRRQPLTSYLKVKGKDSCEQGFIKSIEYALSHWHHHEASYLREGRLKDLLGMQEGMQLCLQAITLFLPMLQCDALLTVHKRLLNDVNRWHWLEDLIALKELRSKKGQYRKKLVPNDSLISYLRGRSEGLMLDYDLPSALSDKKHVTAQLMLMQTLLEKPWREESKNYASKVYEHAKGWLSQGWQSILQAMPKGKVMTAKDYLSHQTTLRQTMYNGLILGNLFDEGRDQFRAPWLDILSGIDELAMLDFLQTELRRSDIDDRADLVEWSNEKLDRLLSVMEQSRKVALQLDAYW